jgi:hypothetical protein
MRKSEMARGLTINGALTCSFPIQGNRLFYCGYHSWTWDYNVVNSQSVAQPLVYAYPPDPSRGQTGLVNCGTPTAAVDQCPIESEVTDTEAHELSETLTDPFIHAWYDPSGNEIGDKCGQTYGAISPDGSDFRLNFAWAYVPFIIQLEWSNSAQGCSLTS